MGNRIDSFVTRLASQHRVLMLGGMAVIRHGLSRHTKDVDIWLEPLATPEAWVAVVAAALAEFQEAKPMRLFPQRVIPLDELATAICEDRVIRVAGLEMPLDIFREPNELEHLTFDGVYANADEFQANFKILSPVELIATKENTGRQHDLTDIYFLQSQVRARWQAQLKTCDLATARALLSRFMDRVVLEAALDNPDPDVQALGKVHLRQFAEEGDPFAIDLWTERFGPL